MNIPKTIIEKAIEGGWNKYVLMGWSPLEIFGVSRFSEEEQSSIALDPLFWSALGKSLGWEGTIDKRPFDSEWQNYAHAFYQRVISNGDTEKFWDDLLAPRRAL